jgi:hypothetical protein
VIFFQLAYDLKSPKFSVMPDLIRHPENQLLECTWISALRQRPMGVKLRFFIVPASWFGSNSLHVILRERLAANIPKVKAIEESLVQAGWKNQF